MIANSNGGVERLSRREPPLLFLELNWLLILLIPPPTCSSKDMTVKSLNILAVTMNGIVRVVVKTICLDLGLVLTSYTAQKAILKGEEVEISTPLAAISSKVTDKPYLFYATKTSPYKVMAYTDGTKEEVGLYVPGTKLGAVSFGGKIYLFQKPLEHPASVWTRVYDGKSWKLGTKVVA
jgi:hypothetical protein